MSLQAAAASVAPGTSPTMHSITTASLGGALASIVGWVLQLHHIDPPPEIVASFGVLGTLIASGVIRWIAA
jgi:xanthosine utilization system XapX-like protein